MGKIPRQSNFELLRLICMFMVMVCHTNGYVNGEDLVGIQGATRLAINQLCVCVDVFVMISGWFGIRATKKGLLNLLFQVAFLGLFCFIVFAVLGQPVSIKKDLLPSLLFGYGYWFVVSYLILYAISPVLNVFCQHASQKEFRTALILFFGAQVLYGFTLDVGHFAYGFSPLFFIGLYLLARYVRLYPGRFSSMNKWCDFAIYVIVSLLSMIGLWFGYRWFGMGFHLNHNDSPLAVIAALYFMLFFSKLSFQNKTINWLAASSFSIYLLHTNVLIYPYYIQIGDYIKKAFGYPTSIGVLFVYLLIVGTFCILIDKVRIGVWNYILKYSNKVISNGHS